ncbi:aldehyde dehydrogenase family protein [Spongorhabdus nitratireducens]
MTVLTVRNPVTGEHDFEFQSTPPDAVAAMASDLRQHQPAWQALGLEQRIVLLQRFASEISANQEAILTALSTDTGRVMLSRLEINMLDDIIERAAGFARSLMQDEQEQCCSVPDIQTNAHYVPHAVSGVISPWNFPFLLAMMESVPALLAGSSVLYKPSEITPRHVTPLRACFARVPALSNVVAFALGGAEVGEAVINHVDAICFTGSAKNGQKVAETAAGNFIPAFLELGGKDPALVLASADLERTAQILLRSSVVATGQACQSVERIYVARSLHDDLVNRLVELAAEVSLTVDTELGHLGPLIDDRQLTVIQSHVDDALAKGAELHCGGKAIFKGGIWYPPTILSEVTHDMSVMVDETFGPVLPVMSFDSSDEAVQLANDSCYGLSASVFAGSRAEGQEIARQLKAGIVSVNEASLSSRVQGFEADAFKRSGMGRSSFGISGVRRFYQRQLILTDQTAEPATIHHFIEQTRQD